MILLTFLLFFVFLLLHTRRLMGDENNVCFKNGTSSDCASLIRSKYGLTEEAFKIKRSRIQSFAASYGREFNTAMACYANGMEYPTPADLCASCITFICENQEETEVCKLFCSQTPGMPLTTPQTQAPSTNENRLTFSTTDEPLSFTKATPQYQFQIPPTSSPFPAQMPLPQLHDVASSSHTNGTSTRLLQSDSSKSESFIFTKWMIIICIVLAAFFVLFLAAVGIFAFCFYYKKSTIHFIAQYY